MKIPKPLTRLPWWAWITGIDLILILLTTLRPYLPTSVPRSLIAPFNLATEMNVAAWYSGICLLALALLSFELFSTGVVRRPVAPSQDSRSRIAWLVLSILLALLSLDEIGSLHEHAGGMAALLPYVAMFALLVAWTMGSLVVARQPRRLVLCLVAMFALFGFVIFQEKLEQIIAWPAWFAGVRAGLEEGTELLGMFLGFWGFARHRSESAVPPVRMGSWRAVVPNPLLFKGQVIILAAGLALHAAASSALAARREVLEIGRLGNPAIWYPVSLFFLLACLAFWKFQRGMGRPWLLLSGFALFASLATVYYISPRPEVSEFYRLGLLFNFYVLSAFLLACFAFFRLRLAPVDGRITLKIAAPYLLAALLLLLAWLFGGLAARWIAAGAGAFLITLDFLALRVPAPIPHPMEAYEPASR